MTAMKLKSPATIDDLLKCPKDGRKYELVRSKDIITAEPILPGFSCSVSRFF